MKKIRFQPNVPDEIRAIDQKTALNILEAIHRYSETGAGRVKPLSGDFDGLRRLRVGNDRVLFDETADTITVHRAEIAAKPIDERFRCRRFFASHPKNRDIFCTVVMLPAAS